MNNNNQYKDKISYGDSVNSIDLYRGDCLEVMDKLIDEGVIVDAIITDPPYGTTACKWDSVIPFDEMWLRLNKLIKPNGAIVLFGNEPFSSALRMSNINNYKYDWVWEKTSPTGFLNAKKEPLRLIENICIFYKKPPTYNPQFIKGKPYKSKWSSGTDVTNETSNWKNNGYYESDDKRYPTNILIVSKDNNRSHPTQKPVALLEYLIKTYTNENELVLDFTMGSGTTAIACLNTSRNFIGIELDKGYVEIAKKRIEEHKLKEVQQCWS